MHYSPWSHEELDTTEQLTHKGLSIIVNVTSSGGGGLIINVPSVTVHFGGRGVFGKLRYFQFCCEIKTVLKA